MDDSLDLRYDSLVGQLHRDADELWTLIMAVDLAWKKPEVVKGMVELMDAKMVEHAKAYQEFRTAVLKISEGFEANNHDED